MIRIRKLPLAVVAAPRRAPLNGKPQEAQTEETLLASWLVIDWDQDQFHLLSVQTTRRGVEITSAVTWAHPEPFTPSTAERVGKAALRGF